MVCRSMHRFAWRSRYAKAAPQSNRWCRRLDGPGHWWPPRWPHAVSAGRLQRRPDVSGHRNAEHAKDFGGAIGGCAVHVPNWEQDGSSSGTPLVRQRPTGCRQPGLCVAAAGAAQAATGRRLAPSTRPPACWLDAGLPVTHQRVQSRMQGRWTPTECGSTTVGRWRHDRVHAVAVGKTTPGCKVWSPTHRASEAHETNQTRCA